MKCLKVVLIVLLFSCSTSYAIPPPEQWQKNDWTKFIDAVAWGSFGDAYTKAGGRFPLVDVYSALNASASAVYPGLERWLNRKRIDACVEADATGNYDKCDRYSAFYNCLTKSSCDELRALESKESPTTSVISATPAGTHVDSLIIPNDKPEKITSLINLEKGVAYTIRASGVIGNWSDKTEGVDAVWCYAEWRCGKEGLPWNQLRIDGKGMSDIAGHSIPFNPSHVYEVKYIGEGKPITLWMYDAQSSSGDNTGSIYVDIYR